MILIFHFHKDILVGRGGFGNDFADLFFLIHFSIISFRTGESDNSINIRVFELPVRSFLSIKYEACSFEIFQ